MAEDPLSSHGVNDEYKALAAVLCNLNKGFKIFHFNARSLNGLKLDYVWDVFSNLDLDIICVTETWFKDYLSDDYYAINNFVLFRNDRPDRRGGGVAIYCRKGLDVKVISKSTNTVTEYMCIEVKQGNYSALVSCVYNPSRHNSLQFFSDEFNNLVTDFDYYFVCGDFNINMLHTGLLSNELLNNISASGLELVNKEFPTRFSKESLPSLLDLCLVSDISAVMKFDQITFVSDHDLIFCCLNIPIRNSRVSTVRTIYDYRNINYSYLLIETSQILWDTCYFLESVNDKLGWLVSVLRNLLDHHVQMKKVKLNNFCPWFSAEVRAAIRKKNLLHSKWKRCSTDFHWSNYVKARNFANSLIKRAKIAFFASRLSSSCSSKELWTNIRSLRIVENSSKKCTLPIEIMSSHFSTEVMSPQPINSHDWLFSDIFDKFYFEGVSETDVAKHLLDIRSSAIGSDNLPIKFIKLVLPFILPCLTHIINHCITSSTFPDIWKIAKIIPIAKNNKPNSPNDYRPISILPVLSKVLERILVLQIEKYLDKKNLLHPLQSGFRYGHSCSTAMLKVIDDIGLSFDNSHLSLLVLIDFSKAFDSVDHDILCRKLASCFHFSYPSVKLISSFLSNRLQSVCIDDRFSPFSNVNVGVPQGSILGPLLFSMFLNDIFRVCEYASMHAYADDVQLYISGDFNMLSDTIFKLNSDLNLINNWALENKLKINAQKTVVLPIIDRSIALGEFPKVMIGNNVLSFVGVAKVLGFFVNTRLSASDHISYVITKIFCSLRLLRVSARYTPCRVRKHLVKQLIMPFISYFSVLYGNLDSLSLGRLNVAFNKAIRYIYALDRYEQISCYVKDFLGMSLANFLQFRRLLFLHNLLRVKKPKYLYDKLILSSSARTSILIVPYYRRLSTGRLFFIDAVRKWNSLPLSIRRISCRSSFRNAIHNHFNSIK